MAGPCSYILVIGINPEVWGLRDPLDFGWGLHKILSCTIKQRVYVFICLFVRLFVCTFALSSVLLTNRLTQALKIRIDYSVNFL